MRVFIIAAFIVCVTHPLSAETILLKNGKNLDGEIVEKTRRHIRLQTENGIVKIPFTMMDEQAAEELNKIPEKTMKKAEAPVIYKGKPVTKEEIDVEQILQPVFKKFKEMTSFQCNGIGVSNTLKNQEMTTAQTYFTLKFQRPNYFLMVSEETTGKGGTQETLAAWNTGATAVSYSSKEKTYSAAPNDTMALMDIGYLKILYQLFSGCESECPLLKDLAYLGNTDLSGETCYLLSHTMPIGYYVLWVSKKRNLILRIDYTLSGYPDEFYRQPTTDAELETILQAMGLETTEKNMKKARQIILKIQPPPDDEEEQEEGPTPKPKQKKKKKKTPPPPPPRGPEHETNIYAELTLDNFELDQKLDPGEFRFGIPDDTTFQSEEDFKQLFADEEK